MIRTGSEAPAETCPMLPGLVWPGGEYGLAVLPNSDPAWRLRIFDDAQYLPQESGRRLPFPPPPAR